MRRTNSLAAHSRHDWQKACLCEWLAASCAFYNEINYRRRQAYFEREDWREAETDQLYDEYAPVLGTGTAQQLVGKNAEMWKSFEELDADPVEDPCPPGYWGNREDGYPLRSVVRNDLYEINWDADRSTIEIPVGKALNEKYDIPGRGHRVTLELRGTPRWKGEQGRLDISYDELADCFRVNQPVTVQPELHESLRRADLTHTLPQENTETTDEQVAAIDLGANNTLTVITEDGDVAIFRARAQFRAFADGLEGIAEMQSRLPDWRYTSARIRRAYRTVYARRDHHRDACVKRAAEWLVDRGVTRVFVGDLSDVLDTHWSATVNQKTHNFWSHGQLTDRLEQTFELFGIELDEVPEAHTSSQCPHCEEDLVVRHGDSLICLLCGLEAHADIVGASLILSDNRNIDVSDWFEPISDGWPMARPAPRDPGRARDEHRYSVTYFQWDDHEWTPISTEETGTLGSSDQRSVSKPASSAGAMAGCVTHHGISLR